MGNFLYYFKDVFRVLSKEPTQIQHKNIPYAIYDPMQSAKPTDRSKDIISYKYRNDPVSLDDVCHKGCDTIWKCFKRTVWRQPNDPFLGERKPLNQSIIQEKYNLSRANEELGEYQWQTWEETD